MPKKTKVEKKRLSDEEVGELIGNHERPKVSNEISSECNHQKLLDSIGGGDIVCPVCGQRAE